MYGKKWKTGAISPLSVLLLVLGHSLVNTTTETTTIKMDSTSC